MPNLTTNYELAVKPEPIELDYNAVKTYYPYTQIYTISEIKPTLEGKVKIMGGQ